MLKSWRVMGRNRAPSAKRRPRLLSDLDVLVVLGDSDKDCRDRLQQLVWDYSLKELREMAFWLEEWQPGKKWVLRSELPINYVIDLRRVTPETAVA